MKEVNIFELLTVITLLVFIVPVKYKQPLSAVISLALGIVTGHWAIQSLFFDTTITEQLSMPFWYHNSRLEIDKLSAFFLLIINFGTLMGLLYSKGYLKHYESVKRPQEFSLHYFFLLWLQIAMILVVCLKEGMPFLVAWEVMSLSSFMLVIFEAENKKILHTGIYYLIQMHVALFFVLAAFTLVEAKTGISGFDGLIPYFNEHAPIPMFLLFFAGFGIKAGFIPLHSWLPHAHPAAPSHVSGIMSGTMIKMGIYGVMRVVTYLHFNLMEIGTIVLAVSIISSVLGVFFAIFQHDLKKMLAFHSIENIGIIGIGIGIGIIGNAIHDPLISMLGFTGALLHVLNHSLFKSLLFFCAGSVFQQCHTRDVNELGGLIKKMPKTSLLFLLASLAICGLPPFNGFISEFLIYRGFFKGLGNSIYTSTLFLGGITALTLTGGLAIFCFTKAFGVVFLGAARTSYVDHAREISGSMLFPKIVIAIFIIAIGLTSFVFVPGITQMAVIFMPPEVSISHDLFSDQMISVSTGLWFFLVLLIVAFLIRSLQQRRKPITYGPTWGCGYGVLTPAHQYTSTSFADNLKNIAGTFSGIRTEYTPIRKEDIFPEPRTYKTEQTDQMEKILILVPSTFLMKLMLKFTVLRSGKIQHYILYGLGFILLIGLLTIANML